MWAHRVSEKRIVQPLYEREELAAITGGPLRPGGLELTGKLLHHSGLAPGATVLDLGCGSGFSLELLIRVYRLVAVGIDPSPLLLAQAGRRAPQATLLQATAQALPCIDGSFAGIVCECVLSLTGDVHLVIREMHRVLRSGGVLLLSDVYAHEKGRFSTSPRATSCVNSTVTLAMMTQALRAANFELLHFWECTDMLKQLAGQIIFDYGSLAAFWNVILGQATGQCTHDCTRTGVKLGYYALVAQKR